MALWPCVVDAVAGCVLKLARRRRDPVVEIFSTPLGHGSVSRRIGREIGLVGGFTGEGCAEMKLDDEARGKNRRLQYLAPQRRRRRRRRRQFRSMPVVPACHARVEANVTVFKVHPFEFKTTVDFFNLCSAQCHATRRLGESDLHRGSNMTKSHGPAQCPIIEYLPPPPRLPGIPARTSVLLTGLRF